MNLNLKVSKEFNHALGKIVWTLSRPNGDMLIPSEGVQSLNYETEEAADSAALRYLGEYYDSFF
jgi:hypothetical protein